MNYVHQPYGNAPPQQQTTSPAYPQAEVGTLPTQPTSFGLPPGSSGPGTPTTGVSPVLVPQVPQQTGATPSPGVSPHGSRKNSATGGDRRASNASNNSTSALHQNNPHSRQVQVNGPDRPPLLYNPDTGVPIPHLAC